MTFGTSVLANVNFQILYSRRATRRAKDADSGDAAAMFCKNRRRPRISAKFCAAVFAASRFLRSSARLARSASSRRAKMGFTCLRMLPVRDRCGLSAAARASRSRAPPRHRLASPFRAAMRRKVAMAERRRSTEPRGARRWATETCRAGAQACARACQCPVHPTLTGPTGCTPAHYAINIITHERFGSTRAASFVGEHLPLPCARTLTGSLRSAGWMIR